MVHACCMNDLIDCSAACWHTWCDVQQMFTCQSYCVMCFWLLRFLNSLRLAHEQVAQVTLVSLLEAEMLQITSGEESSDSDAWPEQNHTHVSMHTLAEYRRGTAHILEVQLIKAALLDTGPRKKQKSRSKKRKHKQSSQSDGA